MGAVIGDSFDNTSELQVMNYQQSMQSTDEKDWKHEINNEH